MSLQRARQRKRKYEVEPGRASFSRIPVYSKYRLEDKITAVTERDDIVSEFPATVFVTDNEVKRTYARMMEFDGVGWVRKKVKRRTFSYRFTAISIDASEIKTMLSVDGVGTLNVFILRGEIDEIRVMIRYDDFSHTSLPKLGYVNSWGEYGLFKSLWYDDATSKSEVILKYPITFERNIKIELQNLGGSATTVEGWFILDIVRSKTLNVTQSGYTTW